jgi:phospholipase C
MIVMVATVAGVLAAASQALGPAPAGSPCGSKLASPGLYRHVILVVMENHSFSQVAGHSPYLNRLAAQCGLATDYMAVTHPSLPNYLALTSGGTDGISNDCTTCSTDAQSVFEQLGSGWRSYEESMPKTGYSGATIGRYAKRHNPAAYYTRISSAYATQDVPLGTPHRGALASDLRHDRLPRLAFITPNLCHDEHDCSLAKGDAWLARWLPVLLASPAYSKGGTVIVVTYDEGNHTENRVYTVIASPTTQPGTTTAIPFTHYSLLRTIEELLGLPCLQHACDTTSMRTAFGL